ncbi:thiol-activated cytolysin family protein [Halogranum gelatinilyticum]|uniref:thiol-activated cytolysin family protein n=1 Tax=Halogranum gelatinilyticum TaxID=660521 RepID=UPI00244EB0FD|nr:thiol-activated cytolysin family protein [Halogranum gelatinilyticum]
MLNVDLTTSSETSSDPPSATTNSGAVSVEVTPDQKQTETTSQGESSTTENDGMVCTVRKKTATTGGSDVFLLNPSMTEVYPGALLTAASIADGSFAPALTSQRRGGVSTQTIRNPLQLSISLANIDGTNTKTVQTPSLGAVRTARNEILDRVGSGATPAVMSYEKQRIYSKDQLDVELGAHFSNPSVDVSGSFDFTQTTETNKLLATFSQKYYDISVSLPNPAGNGVVSDMSYLRKNDVIVNNVSYGRLLFFSVESKYTYQEVETALDVAVKSGLNKVEADLSTADKQVLKNTKVNINVLGGSASSASKLISGYGDTGAAAAIGDWIQRGATYSPSDSPGAPVAYQTKYLSGLQTANVYLSTTYNARTCRPKTRRFRVHNFDIRVVTANDVVGSKNTEELYGSIFVGGRAYSKDGSNSQPIIGLDSWGADSNNWVRVKQGQSKDLNIDNTLEFSTEGELDRRKSYIEVVMEPREHDAAGDEFKGARKSVRWFLSESPSDPDRAGSGRGRFKKRFADRGTEIEITFDITPLPPR